MSCDLVVIVVTITEPFLVVGDVWEVERALGVAGGCSSLLVGSVSWYGAWGMLSFLILVVLVRPHCVQRNQSGLRLNGENVHA